MRYKYIYVDLVSHLVITGIFSVLLYRYTHSIFYVFLCIAGGVLIDIDHLFDYLLCYKDKWSISRFMTCSYVKDSGRLYLIFHSWEIAFILIMVYLIFGYEKAIFAFLLGFFSHMFIDQCISKKGLFSCFFLYRLRHRFYPGCVMDEYAQKEILGDVYWK